MSNPGEIHIEQYGDNHPVVLYSHNRADELPAIVARALDHRERWTDHEYLARVICEELSEQTSGKFTGLGIGTSSQDDALRVIVVDPDEQTVAFKSDHGAIRPDRTGDEYSFQTFINQHTLNYDD